MGFQISPGISITEIDLTTIVPAVGTTIGCIAGPFRWGPANTPMLVDTELTLKSTFGPPDNNTANTWFTCSNFLAYANALQTVRVISTATGGHENATEIGTGLLIQNEDDYLNNWSNGQGSVGQWAAKFAGDLGNSIGVSMADINSFAAWQYKNYFTTSPNTSSVVETGTGSDDEMHIVTIDTLGYWTGTVGTVLETFPFVSKCSVAKAEDNTSSYYATVLNRQSNYVWWMGFPTDDQLGLSGSTPVNWGGDATIQYQTMSTKLTLTSVTGSYTTGEVVQDAAAVIVSSGPTTPAVVTATVSAGSVATFSISSGGSGYTTAPTVVITPTGGDTITVPATATATITDGVITSVTLGVGGATYTHVPLISFTEPGTGATATVVVNGDGRITAVAANNTGSGYVVPPTVTVTGPGSGATIVAVLGTGGNSAKVVSYTVTNGGSGYLPITGTVLSFASDVLEVAMTSGTYVVGDVVTGVTSGAFGTIATDGVNGGPITSSLSGGVDGNPVLQDGDYMNGYDYFASAENIDVSLVLCADADATLVDYIISNVAEYRLDCVAFFSPPQDAVVNNVGYEATDCVNFRNLLPSSSYAFMDCNWKYQYDKYNDVYRWVPLNGDIAGLCVYTDEVANPWWSPAGYNRGMIKNVVRLAWNPRQAYRDELYANSINPVISQPGQGTLLFGDKTLLSKPSAFDRINVRRLFIVLEKAISTAAKFTLFEFNDTFTRAQFINMVTPFLRTVQSGRGIFDFQVVCDTTNNTPQVIDSDSFVGDIYIKPARSINFIQLNFIAVGTGVDFNEVVGSV